MIRDIVRPGLNQWNKNIFDGLEELTNIMKESLECVDLLVLNWLERLKPFDLLDVKEQISSISSLFNKSVDKSVDKSKFQIIILNLSEIKTNKIFWSKLFEKKNIRISSKTLNELINRIKKFIDMFNTIQLKQLTQIQINKNNKLYFWKISNDNLIIGFDNLII
jgi:hypothetical protein